ncbi:MAG TPA: hypothetical protein VKX49_22215 [Bryobacteraceae bacterium]|nr:hypothetical protein [Bryobacteraceae bacterium]
MMKSAADFILGVWNAPEVSVRIEYPLEIMEELRGDVCDELRRLSTGSADPAGALFGISRGPAIRILAWRPISRAAAEEDPARALLRDRAEMVRVLSSAATDPAMQGMEPLGWFVSRGQETGGLTREEVEIFNHFFPNSWQVTMLLRRGPGGTAKAGFFVREDNGFLRTDASYRELLIQPVRRVPGAPDPSGPLPELPKLQDLPVRAPRAQFESTPRFESAPITPPAPPVAARATEARATEALPVEAAPAEARPAEAQLAQASPAAEHTAAIVVPPAPLAKSEPEADKRELTSQEAPPESPAAPVVEIPRKRARIPGIFEFSTPEKRADLAAGKPIEARFAEPAAEAPAQKELPRARIAAITEPASAEKRLEAPSRTQVSKPAGITAHAGVPEKPAIPAEAVTPAQAPVAARPAFPAEPPISDSAVSAPPLQDLRTTQDEAVDLVPAFGMQTHSFGGSRWLWLIPVLAVLGVILFLLMQKTPTPVQSFSLRVASEGETVEISWDPDSVPVREAERGSIDIQDGPTKKSISLSSDQLHAGKTTYARQSGDVALQMNIFGAGGHEFHEFARLVAQPVPSPNPTPLDSGQLQSERDDLVNQVEQLRQQVRKEAARADQAQGVVRILQNRLQVDENRAHPQTGSR